MAEPEVFTNSTENPKRLRIKVFAGANGLFHLYEDDEDNLGENQKFADTKIEFNWEQGLFTIHPTIGNINCLPYKRSYIIELIGVKQVSAFLLQGSGQISVHYTSLNNTLTCMIPDTAVDSKITVSFNKNLELAENHVNEKLFRILDELQIEFNLKYDIYQTILKHDDLAKAMNELQSIVSNRDLLGIISEILSAG